MAQERQKSKSGKYFEFARYINKCNADGARILLEKLNDAAKAGDTRICIIILERRFPEDFGRKQYRKMDVISENKNENVEIIVNNADEIRNEILAKFDGVEESKESLTG